MNGLPDYYQILGVSRSAGPGDLARAYRQQARRCHPDHGGSHEAMLRLNEAWEILRDPASRAAYDEWLTQQGMQSPAISTAVQRARTNADQYPRRWTDFEKWMDSVAKDFTDAEYGCAGSGVWQVPTAKNSISGSTMIFIGGVIGAVLVITLSSLDSQISALWGGERVAIFSRTPVFILFVVGGCLAGATLHKMIGSSIKAARNPSIPRPTPRQTASRSSSPPPIPTPEPGPARKIKIICPHCSQPIEAPADVIGTVVSCPTCNKDFHVGKRTSKPPPVPSQPLQPPPIPNQKPQPPPIP